MKEDKSKRAKKEELKLEDSGLTLKQEAVAVALMLGRTIPSISEEYGVSATRIYEWRQLPEFCTYLKRLQRDAAREIRGRLGQMKDVAVDTINYIMRSGKEETRLKAACYILDNMMGEVKDAKKMRAQARKLYGEKKVG